MSDFSVPLTVNGALYFFTFTAIRNPAAAKYFVSASRAHIPVASFEMRKNTLDEWKVVQPAPDWIEGIEARLSDQINIHTLRTPAPSY